MKSYFFLCKYGDETVSFVAASPLAQFVFLSAARGLSLNHHHVTRVKANRLSLHEPKLSGDEKITSSVSVTIIVNSLLPVEHNDTSDAHVNIHCVRGLQREREKSEKSIN